MHKYRYHPHEHAAAAKVDDLRSTKGDIYQTSTLLRLDRNIQLLIFHL